MTSTYWILLILFLLPFANWIRVIQSASFNDMGAALGVVAVFALCWGIDIGIVITLWLL